MRGVVLLVIFGFGCDQGPGARGVAPPATKDEPKPASEPAEPPVKEYASLASAVEELKPLMGDTNNEHSKGWLQLAYWSATHLKLEDVSVKKNETSFALVQKDPDEERGKRMCYSGQLVQIQREKLKSGKGYTGLLMTWSRNIIHFFAAGSTGKLVEGKSGKFCGVATGKYEYSNSGGGTGHAIDMVGVFDIAENRPQGGSTAQAARADE